MNEPIEATHPVLRAVTGVVLSLVAAGFWGWVAESFTVAGFTLVCAVVPALFELRRRDGDVAGVAFRPFWIGALWVATERLLARLHAAGPPAPGTP